MRNCIPSSPYPSVDAKVEQKLDRPYSFRMKYLSNEVNAINQEAQ